MNKFTLQTALLSLTALIAFAANSILCRLALRDTAIDAVTFTTIRIASGAVTLTMLLMLVPQRQRPRGDWPSAIALYAYAILFSFAYLALSAGTGALLLFGAVQLTMFAAALWRGERLDVLQAVGLVLAVGGVCYLVWPGVSAPPPASAALMLTAGVAWGVYSLRGRGSVAPLADTAGNFLRGLPLALVLSLGMVATQRVDARGVLYAVLSGALASGVGYAIWYAALRDLTVMRAATIQLAVPVLAALGGVAVLSEHISGRLVIATSTVLGGILLVILRRRPRA